MRHVFLNTGATVLPFGVARFGVSCGAAFATKHRKTTSTSITCRVVIADSKSTTRRTLRPGLTLPRSMSCVLTSAEARRETLAVRNPNLRRRLRRAFEAQQPLTGGATLPTLRCMEVHLSPDIQAKLDRLASNTGRSKDEFVQDAMAGYLDELARTRNMLDSRSDEAKSGNVRMIPADEVEAGELPADCSTCGSRPSTAPARMR